jgi:hypothetical protein
MHLLNAMLWLSALRSTVHDKLRAPVLPASFAHVRVV